MKYKTCTEYWLDIENYSLRGNFEQMFRDIEDPWGCHEGTFSLNNRIFVEVLFDKKNAYKRILDIGCGLGGLSHYVYKRNGGGYVLGCDISETAIRKARYLYPDVNFVRKNILEDNINALGEFDLIILSEVLWYILDGIENVMSRICCSLTKGGILAIHQYFPFDQKFGKDVIEGLEGFKDFIANKTPFTFENKVISHSKDGFVLLGTLSRH